MPLCWAQATPATGVRPGAREAPAAGTSILDSVLIGACWAQPCRTQYASAAAKVVTSTSVTHLVADT
jgi:hypothetical protein